MSAYFGMQKQDPGVQMSIVKMLMAMWEGRGHEVENRVTLLHA